MLKPACGKALGQDIWVTDKGLADSKMDDIAARAQRSLPCIKVRESAVRALGRHQCLGKMPSCGFRLDPAEASPTLCMLHACTIEPIFSSRVCMCVSFVHSFARVCVCVGVTL